MRAGFGIFLSCQILVFVLAAGSGVARAGFDDGLRAYRAGDFATALKQWGPLARKGDARVQYYLGRMYQNGEGVEMDAVKAATWYNSAAKKGHVHAQYELGMIFRRMALTEFDYENAVKFLTDAAKQGHPRALFTLGQMYRDGEGVEADTVRAYVMLFAASRKIKEARGPRDQLAKRMTAKQFALAKKQNSKIVDPSAIKSVEAQGGTAGGSPKGVCALARNNLAHAVSNLKMAANGLADCLGEKWDGGGCAPINGTPPGIPTRRCASPRKSWTRAADHLGARPNLAMVDQRIRPASR